VAGSVWLAEAEAAVPDQLLGARGALVHRSGPLSVALKGALPVTVDQRTEQLHHPPA